MISDAFPCVSCVFLCFSCALLLLFCGVSRAFCCFPVCSFVFLWFPMFFICFPTFFSSFCIHVVSNVFYHVAQFSLVFLCTPLHFPCFPKLFCVLLRPSYAFPTIPCVCQCLSNEFLCFSHACFRCFAPMVAYDIPTLTYVLPMPAIGFPMFFLSDSYPSLRNAEPDFHRSRTAASVGWFQSHLMAGWPYSDLVSELGFPQSLGGIGGWNVLFAFFLEEALEHVGSPKNSESIQILGFPIHTAQHYTVFLV